MITLYHAPRSRSSRIIWLLEELRVALPDRARAHPARRRHGIARARRLSRDQSATQGAHDQALSTRSSTSSAPSACSSPTSHPKHAIGPLPGDQPPRRIRALAVLLLGHAGARYGARFQGWDKDGAVTGFGKFEDVEGVISAQLEKTPYILRRRVLRRRHPLRQRVIVFLRTGCSRRASTMTTMSRG